MNKTSQPSLHIPAFYFRFFWSFQSFTPPADRMIKLKTPRLHYEDETYVRCVCMYSWRHIYIEKWSLSASSFRATAVRLRRSRSSRGIFIVRVPDSRIRPALLIRRSERRASWSSLRSRRGESRWYLIACVLIVSLHFPIVPPRSSKPFLASTFFPPYLKFRMWAIEFY